MFEIGLLFLLTSILVASYGVYKWKNAIQRDSKTEAKNIEIKQENVKLEAYQESLKELVENEKTKINEMQAVVDKLNQTAATSFTQYCDILEESYKQKEQEFENELNILDKSYDNIQQTYIDKINVIQNDLDKISATRAAAIEAQLKEKEIKNKKSYYSLNLSALDLKDAKILRDIEYKLNNPRVLRMLIWQNFYREPMNQLCNNVIGITTKSGIYKITNQLTEICYIGQAVDLAKRWKDHAKCGLGIDTPVNNKMYKAMQEDGLENFTWEVLEECKTSELNEKEKFYIELYQANKFGYNSKGGNK